MPTRVFVSEKLRDEADLPARVREVLPAGEQVLAVLAVISSHRVLAGWLSGFDAPGKGWEVEDVASAEVSGFMDNVRFHLREGDEVKVGNLVDGGDEPELHAALSRAHLAASDPEAPVGPTYEVWRP